MEIIIGRDLQTRKLNIIKDGNPYLYGQEGFVPMNVSRQHISLKSLEDGKWQIHNLNDRNVTYVNGIGIESKTISETDIIELGESHFPIPWAAILEPEGETIDISPLKQIWDDYDEKRIQHQIAERKFSAARSATGIITMLASGVGELERELLVGSVAHDASGYHVALWMADCGDVVTVPAIGEVALYDAGPQVEGLLDVADLTSFQLQAQGSQVHAMGVLAIPF